MFKRTIFILAVLLWNLPAWAQVNVRVTTDRDKYLIYESIPITVQVGNYSASSLKLADEEATPWLQIQVLRQDGQKVNPIGPGFLAGSQPLKAGEAIAKSVDIVQYYSIREIGRYRVRAIVKLSGVGGSLMSNECTLDVVNGRTLWSKSQGVLDPAGKDSLRTFSLVEMRLEPYNWLYARIEDSRAGLIYGTIPLGIWVSLGSPVAELDKEANMHVLHEIAPHQFRYDKVTAKGVIAERQAFSDFDSRPQLQRASDGGIQVVGGELIKPAVTTLTPKK